jgi:2-polyprenyl-3-methyl-5-hydroxy-6-metoxy-1,4-benzoquinol methylase
MQPFLTALEIEELYNTKADYFENYVSGPYLENVSAKMSYYRGIRWLIEGRLKRKGSILDIGSATGHFLSVFGETGWSVLGLEMSDWCRNYAKNSFGIDSVKGTVDTAHFPETQFDVITMNHVLEHLDAPLECLLKVRNWLRSDGLLCIEVPNEFNDLVFTFANRPGRRRLYNDTRPVLHHQLFFRPKDLRLLLLAAGWDVLITRTSNWDSPVPCHLFKSEKLNSAARLARKVVLMAGAFAERGEFIFCLASRKDVSSHGAL